MALLEVENLKKYFPVKKGILSRTVGYVRAVDGVSFTLDRGETLGLVGESGCGKTTVGRSILRLIEPTDGRVVFNGKNLLDLDREELRNIRASLQIIFQDPFSSLNPRMSVAQIIGEPIQNHMKISKKEIRDKVAYLMERVGLHPDQMNRYPHEFSGGQRQRIGIARALALNPLAIICDEPVSALDVSIQAQVINLLVQLQEQMNLSYLFIAHDLSVVEHISDRVAVMYLGHIVELATDKELYRNPLHPYSQALLSAVPIPDPEISRKKILLQGDVPSPLNPPEGCPFHTRCPERKEICTEETPVFRNMGGEHWVACHLR
ncbi:MAG: dipeptide ABC transporter ATP-binding protein [Deltaproteobacteria bacterium]|nr:dipeptide ABC transporter ATP-binding protein [Deltaproteobacteria bacterium]MBW2015759.1 dipeptide ABC transporter ATP-binding protein [Deltaproteobacteria bacterium]MBW2128696.1 dipeptide ABC transporter ATP-binding protein [Deltaproteobacteria bacterium]MBW2302724.1 dipeptide ABC transporter ATP-binding protein [Deltaproteobacteria bacterium]